MIQLSQAIVIDKDGYKLEVIPVWFDKDKQPHPVSYDMPTEASLVFESIGNAFSMTKPRWTGFSWEETATDKEVEAARLEKEEEYF